ncbi:cilium assembly protein DZIP1-like isoform X2 [Mixophyes fleayi]|uniref:cilium assembly protein DZIP1-like isoform X2 n=1 Tax=Mixophyes fleayi TaxID=3061075 RepID=UPI003F4E1F8B
MPIFDNVYYPFEPERTHVSPVLLNTPRVPHSTTPTSMPSSNHGTLFKFRSRHEGVDWRRIGAIDVDRLANELDFATLQENIMGITFCCIEHEKCSHCHNSLDPILVKLFRLAQFTIEYLLHSQDYLTSNVQKLEEKVHASLCEAEQVKQKMIKQSAEIKSLKEECKLRKKIIATQQMMVSAGAGSYHKCQHCEKAFMNYSYLQDHIKRRHNEVKHNLQSSDKLQYEINCLKEELQTAKTQLDAEHAAHIEKLSQMQENEHKKYEQEVLKKFDNWKKEERNKFEDELKKVKEMFMNELKELKAKNSWLENDLHEIKKDGLHGRSALGTLQESPRHTDEGKSRCTHDIQSVKELLEMQENKWTKRMHELQKKHEREKNQLILQTEKLQLSINEDQRTSNDFYKKRLDEIGQRFQEQKKLIKRQKDQIKELSMKPPPAGKKFPVPTPAPKLQHVEAKHGTSREQAHILQPIQELEEDKDLDNEEAESTSKKHVINALKKNPTLTKELRKLLEQEMVERLESLGVKPGVREISNDHFNRIMDVVESRREEQEKCIPEIQQLRENLIRQVKQKAEEHASAEGKSYTFGSTTSDSLRRHTKFKPSALKSSVKELHAKPRYPIPRTRSTPNTPPFSSDDESDMQDVPLHSNKCFDSVKTKCALSAKDFVGFAASESDSDGSVLEEIKPQPGHKRYTEMQAPAKQGPAPLVKERTEQLEMARCSRSVNPPIAGVDVANVFMKNDRDKDLKVTDLDDTEFDSSSLNEEPFEVPTSTIHCLQSMARKKEFPVSVKNTFGAAKLTKGDAREADTSSTLVSSLVTVSDFSDTSDM